VRPLLPPPLVALTPGDLSESGAAGRTRFLDALARATEAGWRGLLVREPGLHDRALVELVADIRRRIPDEGWLGLHDRVHLAEACGVQAVHLGFRSLAPAEARRVLPEGVALGFSAHAGDDVAVWSACDYLFLGPVLETPSKRGWKEPLGFERLAVAVERSPAPVWAIGGVKPEHVRACLEVGCAGAAVRAGLFEARDPGRAAREYRSAAEASPGMNLLFPRGRPS